jgi:hypothetical protein
MYVYLDWNIFDRIEKIERLENRDKELYGFIEELINNKTIITPYSNAHINDLLRGYDRNPDFIEKHLSTLKRLTNDLCIVQYWGNDNTTWHYRDVKEFFNSALEDAEFSTKSSFRELLDFDETGLWEQQLLKLELTKMPENFKDLFKINPVFSSIFPRTKIELNALSFCEDIYEFSNNAKKDYSLYKSLRVFVNQSRIKLTKSPNLVKEIDKSMKGKPKHLDTDDIWEVHSTKNNSNNNSVYQKITNTYCKIDFRGFKSDEKFSNLIDDSLHAFYGAHCDFFITLDDKCHYKANETYKELKISTKALTPNEFMEIYKNTI